MIKISIVDADAIIAVFSPNDANHQKASDTLEKLLETETLLLYPSTAICEAATVVQKVLNNSLSAKDIIDTLGQAEDAIVSIDHEIILNASKKYFSVKGSKKNTIFDCIVAYCAEKYQADSIFSYDAFYKSKGFKLASDIYMAK